MNVKLMLFALCSRRIVVRPLLIALTNKIQKEIAKSNQNQQRKVKFNANYHYFDINSPRMVYSDEYKISYSDP